MGTFLTLPHWCSQRVLSKFPTLHTFKAGQTLQFAPGNICVTEEFSLYSQAKTSWGEGAPWNATSIPDSCCINPKSWDRAWKTLRAAEHQCKRSWQKLNWKDEPFVQFIHETVPQITACCVISHHQSCSLQLSDPLLRVPALREAPSWFNTWQGSGSFPIPRAAPRIASWLSHCFVFLASSTLTKASLGRR